MERQEVSEGGGARVGCVHLDATKLGNGSEVSSTINQGGTAAATGSKYTAEQRAIRMEATRRYRAKKFKDRPKKRVGIDLENRKIKRTLWLNKNREHVRSVHRAWVENNRQRRRDDSKRYAANRTPEQIDRDKSYHADYRAKNKPKAKAYMADWTQRNKEVLKQKQKEYLPRRLALNRHKRATDPIQRLKDACRTRVGFILRKAGVAKFNHTFELIGCTPDFFKAYLTAKFKPGMTWENYGTWEIDHHIPLAAWDISNHEQRLRAFHYSNCQPLWKIENRMKNDTLPSSHQPLFL